MDKNNKPSKSEKVFKKYRWIWQSALVLGLISSAIYGFSIWQTDSQNHDLSLIGKGENIVVHVHDPG